MFLQPPTETEANARLYQLTSQTTGRCIARRRLLLAGLGSRLAAASDAPSAAAVLTASDGDAMTQREIALARWVRKTVKDPNGTTAHDVQTARRRTLGPGDF